MPDIPYRAFRDALSLLRGLTKADFERAGVKLLPGEWEIYNEDPALFFLSVGESRARPLWGLIEARMVAGARERVPA